MAKQFWEDSQIVEPAPTQQTQRRREPPPVIAFDDPTPNPADQRGKELRNRQIERDLETPKPDPNAPKLPTGYRWKGGVVNGEAERIPGTQNADGTAVPAAEFNRARDYVGMYEGLQGSANDFEDNFGGNLLGGIENTLQAYGLDFGMDTPGQSEWWATFKGLDNQIRNDLFGSALTESERQAYAGTTVEPGMTPEKIKANLTKRAGILRGALIRDRDFMLSNGRKPDAVDALYRPIIEAQRRLEDTVLNADVRALPKLPFDQQGGTGYNMPGGDRPALGSSPGQIAQIIARNPDITASGLNDWAQNALGSPIGPPEEVQRLIAEYRRTGQLPEDAAIIEMGRNAELDAQLKARGLEDGPSRAQSFAGGYTGTLVDEGAGIVGGLTDLVTGGSFVDGYTRERDLIRRADEKGSTAATIAGAAFSPIAAFKNPTNSVRIAANRGALGGAVFGFGSGEGAADTIVDTAAGGVIGAGLGAVAQRFLGGRPPGAPPATPSASAKAYQDQINAGVPNPTLGSTKGGAYATAENALALAPGGGKVATNTQANLQGAAQAADDVANRFGNGGSFVSRGEALIDGANKWMDKAEQVVRKAYDAVPISSKARASTQNTQAYLDSVADEFDSQVLQQAFQSGELATFGKAVKGDLTWKDIKSWRSRIGGLIGQAVLVGDDVGAKQLRGLYGSLSDDMRATASALGPNALSKFERANALFQGKQERIEKTLVSILGKSGDDPAERAAGLIETISKANKRTSDIKKLADIRKSIPADEWSTVSSSMIRLMGQPRDNPALAFSPESFLSAFKGMDDAAKNIIFGKSELRSRLDDFASAMEGLATVQKSGNPSRSGVLGSLLVGLGNLSTLGSAALTANLASRLWTNPRFVQWATGYTKMIRGAAQGGRMPSAAAIANQSNLMGKAAASAGASANDVLNMQQALGSAFEQTPNRLAAEPTDEQGQM